MTLFPVLALCIFPHVWTESQVFKWQQPEIQGPLIKRQEGYSPQYKTCGTGHDCSSCGDTFEQCVSPVDLAIFCYNPGAGQKCCPNGQGKACDSGFYCAEDSTRHTWCCPENLNLQQCAVLHNVPALESAVAPPVSTTPPVTSVSVTVTVTIGTAVTSIPVTSAMGNSNTTTNTTSILVAGVDRTMHQKNFLAVLVPMILTFFMYS